MLPATRLGERESLELNVAFFVKVVMGQTEYAINYRAEAPMSKDRPLEFHLPGAPSLRATSRSGQDV